MVTEQILSSTDQQQLFDFINSCHLSCNQLESDLLPKLQGLIRYETFAYGTLELHPSRKLRHLGGKLATGVIDDGVLHRRSPLHGLVNDWLRSREPVYSEPCDIGSHERREGLASHHSHLCALHCMADPSHRSATWYAFAKIRFGARDDHLMRMAVPHLHSAVVAATAVSRSNAVSVLKPLTRRELEVLEWLSKGKTNAEIGVVLGISICTARVHVQNIFNKLPANNRTHAAARAHQLGLLDGNKTERKPLLDAHVVAID